jgi:hypothetical protein
MERVTFVLTSCGRLDLLEKTLDSFFKFNTYPIERYIIIEDSEDKKFFNKCLELNNKYDNKLEFIFNEVKLGQTKSIDLAYSMVETPYIFHLEDDWEFYKNGFIEKSIELLKFRQDILQVWIRPKSDKILNNMGSKVFNYNDILYRKVLPVSFYTGRLLEDDKKEIVFNYNGFSFNPGIKRLIDYKLIDKYQNYSQEHLVDYFYRDLGYSVVSLSVDDSDGYVKHIGWDRRVPNTIL